MQAAYLVGISDPNSHAGQQGLVDPAQFARANQAIQMACQNLVDPSCIQTQVRYVLVGVKSAFWQNPMIGTAGEESRLSRL